MQTPNERQPNSPLKNLNAKERESLLAELRALKQQTDRFDEALSKGTEVDVRRALV